MLSSSFIYQKKKTSAVAKLSLVSLMDIFTILVFFLLLNSGESENIEYTKYVTLPDSSSGISPHQDLLIMVGEKEIWFEEQKVVDVAEVIKNPKDVIEPLSELLADHANKISEQLTAFEKEKGLSITIMGDKSAPYQVIKSVMMTCRFNDYRNISLAATQVIGQSAVSFDTSGISAGGEG